MKLVWLAGGLGLLAGSFLNVVIYRLPRKLSVVWGRSFCPRCKKKISWFDNLPLLSFILLKGRCRHCRSPISWRYPVVELLTGVLFVLGVLRLGDLSSLNYLKIAELGLTLILFSALVVIFFIDLEHQVIPDEILLPVIFLFLLSKISASPFNTFLPAAGASLFLFLIWAVTRGRGMGLGDVKLAFLMGLVLGFPKVVVAFYLAFLTGAIIGVILILVKKARFGQKIAFGPFLAAATVVTFLWGEKIFSFTQKLLF
jgi:prepilin signal peptidase PulO-like enzyme (type II secretory pathway)